MMMAGVKFGKLRVRNGGMLLSVIVASRDGRMPRGLNEDPRLELVVVKGVKPVGRARNEGLARATGDYIAWVDSDDEVTDDWLNEILRGLDACPDVLVLGHTWMLEEHVGREKIWSGGDLLESVLSQRILRPEMWNYVVRRELWDGIRFDDAARTLEDWDVAPRLLMKAREVGCVRRSVYRYRARAGSLTHRADESMQREVFVRALARIPQLKRLGLWRRYGRMATGGVGYMVYCCAETLALSGNARCETKRAAERWIRWHLPGLLVAPAPGTFRVKWLLAALGCWDAVRWYYSRMQGRKI